MIDTKFSTDFVVDAAKLRMHQMRADRLLSDYSGTTFFALDTPVVTMFTDPASNPFGRVFRSDKPHEATAMTLALGEYVFFEMTDLPFFQLAPHFRETGSIFDIISRAAVSRDEDDLEEYVEIFKERFFRERRFIEENYSDEVSANRNELLSNDSSTREKGEFFQDGLEGMLKIVLPNSERKAKNSAGNVNAGREYLRFLKLLAGSKLLIQDDMQSILQSTESYKFIAEGFRPEGTIAEWATHSERKQAWLSEFSSIDIKRKPHNLENDAEALASLEQLNERLSRYNARVILLSGDQLILQAAELRSAKQSSSKYAFVLDPVAFIFDALSWQGNRAVGDDRHQYSNWLDGLLTTYTGGKERFFSEIEDLAKATPDSISRLRESLELLDAEGGGFEERLGTWEEFKKPVLALELIYNSGENDLFRALVGDSPGSEVGGEIDTKLAELRDDAVSRIDRKWDDILISFTRAGVGLLYGFRHGSGQMQRPRNPPIIRFDGFPTATRLVHDLSQTHDLHSVTRLSERLQEIGNDTYSADLGNTDLGYLSCLVYAAICASEVKWAVARGLASRAVRIAESGPIPTKGDVEISGREAYYLLGMSQRLTLSFDHQEPQASLQKIRSNLSHADANLDKAINALAKEREAKDGVFLEKKTIKGIRFSTEKLAVETTRLNVEHWLDHPAKDFCNRLLSLAQQNLDEVPRLESLLEMTSLPEQAHSLRTMIVSLCVNALQCMHLGFRAGIGPKLRTLVLDAKVSETLDSYLPPNLEDEEWGLHRTLLIEAYLCLSYFTEGFSARRKSEVRHSVVLLREKIHQVMPYDKARFSDLEELLESDDLRVE